MANKKSRTISEVFRSIAPRGLGTSQGIPAAPTIAEGVSSSGDLAGALSSAGEAVKQLQAAYESQGALVQANTAALASNTSAKSSASAAAGAVSSVFGGGGLLGLLDPIDLLVKGFSSLFGGSSGSAPLPIYVPPPPVALSGNLSSAAPAAAASGAPQSSAAASSAPATVNVTVSAMDSQSFMDHSTDIANAVREAMLNMHPINGVVQSL